MAEALWIPLAFVLTVAIEWPVLAWFSKLGFARTGWFCLCMNGITWGCFMGIRALWDVPIPLGEVAVIFAEAALLRWFWNWGFWRAFAGAALMNGASWLIGSPVLLFIVSSLQ